MKTFSRKRKSNAQFIVEANIVHGNKYDYTHSFYINAHTLITIGCPIHGLFQQLPYHHLNGHGCPKCKVDARKRLVYGVGIYDGYGECLNNPAYITWNGMLRRVYDNKLHKKRPTYTETQVCKDWLLYSNFKAWFENPENGYHEGYHLDKDILVKGNKIYSPDTCCFVPPEINSLIIKTERSRHDLPLGTYKNKNKFIAILKGKSLGNFFTPEEAHLAYINAKRQLIKDMADSYLSKNMITKRVFDALVRYEIA